MIKRYKAGFCYYDISVGHFVRETEEFLWTVAGTRRPKWASTYVYADTFEDAKARLISKVKEDLQSARLSVVRLNSHLSVAEGLSEDDVIVD